MCLSSLRASFEYVGDGNDEVYAMNPDGSNRTTLSSAIDFSPDTVSTTIRRHYRH